MKEDKKPFKDKNLYSLKLMPPGETVEILHIGSKNDIFRRLREIGLREGVIADVVGRDPLGKRVLLKLESTFVALDEDLCTSILVKPLLSRYHELREKLYFDLLTGCYKREVFEPILENLVLKPPCAIALLDLDDFKKVNDLYGHLCGDQVLKEVGKLLKENLRKQDLVIRWGGEEFLLYIYKASSEVALKVCERIRSVIFSNTFVCKEEKIRITASIGICRVPPIRPLKVLLELADKALYKAKQTGKNKVILLNEL